MCFGRFRNYRTGVDDAPLSHDNAWVDGNVGAYPATALNQDRSEAIAVHAPPPDRASDVMGQRDDRAPVADPHRLADLDATAGIDQSFRADERTLSQRQAMRIDNRAARIDKGPFLYRDEVQHVFCQHGRLFSVLQSAVRRRGVPRGQLPTVSVPDLRPRVKIPTDRRDRHVGLEADVWLLVGEVVDPAIE